MQTSLDLALIRWSVMHRKWHELANDMPCLGAFLAGWFLRDMSPKGTQPPPVASFRNSFRVGWREADSEIAIMEAAKTICTDCEGRGGHARSEVYGGIKLCPTCNGEGDLPNQNNKL